MNCLFLHYDGASSVKWSSSGKFHIGLRKLFLGLLSWSKQASVSNEATIRLSEIVIKHSTLLLTKIFSNTKMKTIQQLICALPLYRDFRWSLGTRNSTTCCLKLQISLIQPDAPADRNSDPKASFFYHW